MWRSFFFATGITLIIVGVQCLVVDTFLIADSTRLPSVVTRFLDDIRGPGAQNKQPAGYPQFVNSTSQGAIPSYGGVGNSRFGPSRFGDNGLSNSNLPPSLGGSQSYYGGLPGQTLGTRANPNQPFSLAGFSTNKNNPANNGPFGKKIKARYFQTKEWMPWSLLAVGTLVVLYTNSTGRGSYSSD